MHLGFKKSLSSPNPPKAIVFFPETRKMPIKGVVGKNAILF